MAQPSFLSASGYVAAGGALGAWLRFLVGYAWLQAIGPVAATAFPWATLTVNVAGSFAMGLLAGWLAHFGSPNPLWAEGWRLLLGAGLLGGFTTFSAFSLEVAMLIERGTVSAAAAYVAVSLVAGFGGLFAGLYVMRAFT